MHVQKTNNCFCLRPKIGEGGDDKQVINLIRPNDSINFLRFFSILPLKINTDK